MSHTAQNKQKNKKIHIDAILRMVNPTSLFFYWNYAIIFSNFIIVSWAREKVFDKIRAWLKFYTI